MNEPMQAYCMKCKTQREMQNPQAVFTATGTPATRGTCPVCGTTLFRMGATPAHDGMTKPEVQPKAAKSTTTKRTTAKATKRSTAKKTSKTAGRAASVNGTAKTAMSAKPTRAKTAKSSKSSTKTTKAVAKSSRTGAASSNGTAKAARGGKLVIVESPAKARSVGRFLGRGYTVKASKGHVRDLLTSQLSVDVNNDFEPKYRVPNEKRDTVRELKHAVESAAEVYLATDPDREGEAIAWHLMAATELDAAQQAGVPVRRVVFHEITQPAIEEAFGHPRDVDMNLVNAQQARRILDRLVGYPVSELLWQKVRRGLSAGRVQSIAMRVIVDREREIEAFVSKEYWTLDARLSKRNAAGKDAGRAFIARLVKIGEQDAEFNNEGEVTPHLAILERAVYAVADVKRGERVRKPSAPFTTSTLQQEASRRLNFSAARTMSVAQQLYEGIDLAGEGSVGLITYMRTDSMNVSPIAQKEARDYLRERFGKDYVPASAPQYKTKAKGAQEAHEAIRPTSILREPDKLKAALTGEQFRLYTLIWQRFVASQMANAIYNTLRVEIAATAQGAPTYGFRVSGSTIKFSGFLALYEDARDEDVALDEDEGRVLPDFAVGELLTLLGLLPEQHFTQPPPRYTEASLVRTLEENGIGRPSTYAQTVKVITEREYVSKKDKRLTPTETGRTVTDLLINYFPEMMDINFTARMEGQLDHIAEGKLEWQPMLHGFYTPFSRELEYARGAMPALQKEEAVGRDCPVCSNPLLIKYGRFGKFIGCSNYPECRHTEPYLERLSIACPLCGEAHGGELIVKRTRRGKTFYGCSRYPACEYTSWKRPLPTPCPHCGGLLLEQNRTTAQCSNCGRSVRLADIGEVEAEMA